MFLFQPLGTVINCNKLSMVLEYYMIDFIIIKIINELKFANFELDKIFIRKFVLSKNEIIKQFCDLKISLFSLKGYFW